jgi:hypothetical protein
MGALKKVSPDENVEGIFLVGRNDIINEEATLKRIICKNAVELMNM